MNLPHETLDHLPHLLPLLNSTGPSMVRGWFVVEAQDIPSAETIFNRILHLHSNLVEPIHLEIRRQFNASKVLTRFEARLGEW